MKRFRLTLVTEITLTDPYAKVDRGWVRMVAANEIESYVPRRGMEFGPTTVIEAVEVKADEQADDEG